MLILGQFVNPLVAVCYAIYISIEWVNNIKIHNTPPSLYVYLKGNVNEF